MPKERDWRHILANGVSATLSIPEEGHRFEVLPWASLKPAESWPFGLIQEGESDPDGQSFRSVCVRESTLVVWLVVADPGTEPAADLLDELLDRLYSSGLEACRDDPLNTDRFVPPLGAATRPEVIDFGSVQAWARSVAVTVPVSIHPT
ncbi:MAG: hypothetical protein ACRCW4_13415 [Candidatus Neomicrothrix subdominans]